MKERAIDRERAVVAHHQAAEVSEPGVGAFDDPATSVPPQRSAILRRRFLAVGAMRRDQFDSAPCQPLAQRIAVVGLRSEEHTSELQSLTNLVCRLLLEKKKQNIVPKITSETTR